MTCTHERWEIDVAVDADGYCPLCMKERLSAAERDAARYRLMRELSPAEGLMLYA